jgi:hypothetical protein
MDLEQALDKIVEPGREELRIVASGVRRARAVTCPGSLGGCPCWPEMVAGVAGGRVMAGGLRGDSRSCRRRGGVVASASA